MKHNIFFAAAGAALLLTLGACSEGQYWEEPGNLGNVYAFPKPVQTLSYSKSDVPTAISVMVNRTYAGAAVDVPVTFSTTDETAFSGPETVSFAAGATSAEYIITVAPENLNPGSNKVVIELDEPEGTLLQPNASNLSYTLNFTLDYTWVSAGTAECVSAWVQNETPIKVAVEEAKEYSDEAGQRMFRLVSPYFVMEPEYAEEGYNIQFLTTAAGEAVTLNPTLQPIGEESDGLWFIIGSYPGYGAFFSNGDEYTIDSFVFYTEGRDGNDLYILNFEEVLSFKWTCPAK